jgi:hypothetical protein
LQILEDTHRNFPLVIDSTIERDKKRHMLI